MRHTVRPFVKEFKNRSSKLAASVGRDDNANVKQPVLTPDFSGCGTNDDDGYQAALKAADEVFGKSGSAAPDQTMAPSPDASIGRVLPSLVAGDNAQLTETEDKSCVAKRVGKPKRSPKARLKKPVVPSKAEPAKISVAEEESNTSLERSIAPATHRKLSSIQKRWVRKTELKAGQKWKRRLCQAAR